MLQRRRIWSRGGQIASAPQSVLEAVAGLRVSPMHVQSAANRVTDRTQGISTSRIRKLGLGDGSLAPMNSSRCAQKNLIQARTRVWSRDFGKGNSTRSTGPLPVVRGWHQSRSPGGSVPAMVAARDWRSVDPCNRRDSHAGVEGCCRLGLDAPQEVPVSVRAPPFPPVCYLLRPDDEGLPRLSVRLPLR